MWKRSYLAVCLALAIPFLMFGPALTPAAATLPVTHAGDVSVPEPMVDLDRVGSPLWGPDAVRLEIPRGDRMLDVLSPFPLHMEVGDEVASVLAVSPEVLDRVEPRLLDVVALTEDGLIDEEGRVPVIMVMPNVDASLLDGIPVPLVDLRPFERVGLVAARVSLADLPVVATSTGVDRVYLDDFLQVQLAQSVPLIGAPLVHQQTTSSGENVRGQGVTIAILDTGIDHTHPDLGGCFGAGCKVVGGYDFVNDHGAPLDDHGHGTHVAATAAGSFGVAPGASLLDYKVCGATGGCARSDIIAAIENATLAGADIISMSLGGPGPTDGSLSLAADWAVEQGVVVVSAAGNSGSRHFTVGEPGSALRGIAVGATDKNDNIASFSSRGPVKDSSGDIVALKPDLVAPGVDIVAAVPNGTCSLCDPSGYRALSGTSMATPHVSGTAALLLQGRPDWAPDDVKAALLGSTKALGADTRAEGTGRVDAWGAWNAEIGLLPGNLLLGLTTPGQSSTTLTQNITVKNLGQVTRTVDLAPSSSGFSASVSPTEVTVAAGSEASVTLSAEIAGSQATNWYQGTLVASSEAPAARLRMSLWHTELIHFDLGESVWVVSIFKDGSSVAWRVGEERFVLPAAAGTYHVRVSYSGCPSAEPCASATVLVGPLSHSGQTWINRTIQDAAHPVMTAAKRANGTAIDLNYTWACPRERSDTACSPGNARMWHFAESSSIGMSWGGSSRPDYHSVADETWSFGKATRVQEGYDLYIFTNSTNGISGPVVFGTAPERYRSFGIQHEVPPEYEWGRRMNWCVWQNAAFGSDTMQVEHDAVENYHLSIEAKKLVYSPNPDIPAALCDRTKIDLDAGSMDWWRNCTDPSGCKSIGRSDIFSFTEDGEFRQHQDIWGRPPSDNRFTVVNGTVKVIDGAPALTGRISPGADHVALTTPRGRGFFQPASGGFNFDPLYLRRPLHYGLSLENDTIANGLSTSVTAPLLDEDLPGRGAVQVRAHTSGAYLDGLTCAARYEANYHTDTTTGTLPAIEWTRVQGDGVFGTRFPVGADVVSRFALGDVEDWDALDVSARVWNGNHSFSFSGLQPEGDVYALPIGVVGEGPWSLLINVTTGRNETVHLTQEPSFIIGTGGCGLMSPVADVDVSPRVVGVGQNVTYNASTSYHPAGGNLSYEWIKESMVVSTDPVWVATLETAGRHCATVRVKSDAGLVDEVSVCAAAAEPPVAIATADPARGNIGDPFFFDGTASYMPNGTLQGYQWHYDGALVSSDPTYTMAFSEGGAHCLALTVTGDFGLTDTDEACVEVNHPPNVEAVVDKPRVNAGVPVTFDGSGSWDADGSIASYEWTYLGAVVSTDPIHNMSFSEPGTTHCLTLRVADDEGAIGSEDACVYVNLPPSAVATPDPVEPVVDQNVSFDGSASSDDDGSLVSFEWTYEGEVVSSTAHHTMSFSSTGQHCLVLVVMDDDAAADSAEACVNVRLAPVAVATASPGRANVGDPFTFDGADSYSPNGTIEAYSWYRDGVLVSTEAVHDVSFATPGEKCLDLIVTDDSGATGEAVVCVAVNHPPVADAVADPSRANAGDPVTFDGNASADPDGTVVAYEWVYEGNVVSTEVAHTMTFVETGVDHCATLTIVDDEGASESDTACVYLNIPPVARTDADHDSVVVGDVVLFMGAGSTDADGVVTAFSWQYGGETWAVSENASLAFDAPGEHCVSLSVADDDGAVDFAEHCVLVVDEPVPVAVANVSSDQTNRDIAVTFDGTESFDDDPLGRDLHYSWSLDDTVVSTKATFSRSFDSLGTFCLTLEVTNRWGHNGTDVVCVEVVQDLLVDVVPTQENYLPGETPTVDLWVRSADNATLSGASVRISLWYGGSDRELLEAGGCATSWEASARLTGHHYRFTSTLSERCGGAHRPLDVVTVGPAQWRVEVVATKSGNKGIGTAAYHVVGGVV